MEWKCLLLHRELKVDVDDIVDMDLCLMDNNPSALSGIYEEFLSSGRLDNLASCFGIMGGFCDFLNRAGKRFFHFQKTIH